MAGYTDDTTVDDEYEMSRLDALSVDERNIAGAHQIDQFEAVDPYAERFVDFAGSHPILTDQRQA